MPKQSPVLSKKSEETRVSTLNKRRYEGLLRVISSCAWSLMEVPKVQTDCKNPRGVELVMDSNMLHIDCILKRCHYSHYSSQPQPRTFGPCHKHFSSLPYFSIVPRQRFL